MKICIILPKGLPIPCVKGGAIEKLINDIIDKNEEKKELDITVCTIYDQDAFIKSREYKYTKYIYIKNDLKYKIMGILVRLHNLVSKNKENTYNEVILDRIKDEKFDYIVVEDGAYRCFSSYHKYYSTKQMLLHFHHNGKSDEITDKTFSTYIGVSQFVANTFKHSSKIKDVVVLKNGINIDKFKKEIKAEEKIKIRERLGFNSNDFVIIFCGRLIQEKGVIELVRAIKQIEEDDIKLMIVGSINFGKSGTSEYLQKLNEEVKNSNGKVMLTGYIDNDETYKYYQSADIGVIPSTWEDAAPLTTIEIMTNRLPLIVTRTGGAPEYASEKTIIIPKDENIIKNLKKEVLALYNNPLLRIEMSTSGYEHATQFSTENFYNNFVEILKRKDEINNEQK